MIESQVTIIVKTFIRSKCLKRLVYSIRRFYPSLTICILDDSNIKKIIPDYVKRDDNITYILSEYDIGVSKGRNILLNSVKTPYVITVDDDFIFTEYTRIGSLLNNIMNSDYDIIGGLINDRNTLLKFYGDFHLDNNTLKYESKFNITSKNITPCDIIPQFFIAKTDNLNIYENNWDNDIKIGEHTDFFLRIYERMNIGYITSCIVDHFPVVIGEYRKYRLRGNLFKEYIAMKHNINKIIDFNNKEWYRNG